MSIISEDIMACKNIGIDGVVIGVLTEDSQIDMACMRKLALLAHPMSVTFHRAFDVTGDPVAALHALHALNSTPDGKHGHLVHRILTSGQQRCCTDEKALEIIARLVRISKEESMGIVIMPGGGITTENVAQIMQSTGAQELHASARVSESDSAHSDSQAQNVLLSDFGVNDMFLTSSALVRDMVAQMAPYIHR